MAAAAAAAGGPGFCHAWQVTYDYTQRFNIGGCVHVFNEIGPGEKEEGIGIHTSVLFAFEK